MTVLLGKYYIKNKVSENKTLHSFFFFYNQETIYLLKYKHPRFEKNAFIVVPPPLSIPRLFILKTKGKVNES